MSTTIQKTPLLKTKPFDPVASFKRHWLKIVIFGGFIFLLLSPLSIIMSKPFYTASGKIRITPVTTSYISRSEERSITGYYSSYVSTQVDMIVNQDILEKAVDRLPANAKAIYLPAGMPLSIAARNIKTNLKVRQIPGTHLINIQIFGRRPEGLSEVINSIIEVFIEHYRNEEEGRDYRRLSYLKQEKEKIEGNISELTKIYRQLSQKAGTSTFVESHNFLENALFKMQELYISAYNGRLIKENHLKQLLEEAKIQKTIPVDPFVNELVENNNMISQIDLLNYNLINELRTSLNDMTVDNPEYAATLNRIEKIKDYFNEHKKNLKDKTKKALIDKREIEQDINILSAKAELNAARETENELAKKIEELKIGKADISQTILRGQQVRNQIINSEELLKRIDTRYQELQLESKAPGRINLESQAVPPLMPAGSNMKKILIVIFLFSFGSVSSISLLFDLMDNRVRGRKDILSCLGATPTWPISDYNSLSFSNIPFSRVTLDDPGNTVSKSIHSLAIRLDKERRDHNAKIAVFTGVDAKSGASEILINTAHTMSNLCEKVLLIEANFDSPSFNHSLKNLSNDGLIDYLLGNSDLNRIIQRDMERNIDYIPAGRLKNNKDISHINMAKIPKMLDQFRSTYDFIIIDTSPILVSDFTEFLIIQADIVPLVIQGDRSFYSHVYRVGQILFRLEVPSVAVILNWGAPRSINKIQKFVFQVVWPIQTRLKYQFSKFFNFHSKKTTPIIDVSKALNSLSAFFFTKVHISYISDKKLKYIFTSGLLLLLFITLFIIILLNFSIFNQPSSTVNMVKKIVQNDPEGYVAPNTKDTSLKDFKMANSNFLSLNEKQIESYPNNKEIVKNPLSDQADQINYSVKLPHGSDDIYSMIKNEKWILEQKSDLYTIQLMASADKLKLMHFIEQNNLNKSVACFHRFYKGTDWYSLIYGQYEGWSNAVKALASLPNELHVCSPWIRHIKDIQGLIKENEKFSYVYND